jgi:hypothetical protein
LTSLRRPVRLALASERAATLPSFAPSPVRSTSRWSEHADRTAYRCEASFLRSRAVISCACRRPSVSNTHGKHTPSMRRTARRQSIDFADMVVSSRPVSSYSVRARPRSNANFGSGTFIPRSSRSASVSPEARVRASRIHPVQSPSSPERVGPGALSTAERPPSSIAGNRVGFHPTGTLGGS